MTILLFIAVIFVLVFVHELGHFLFAKMTGCRVDEFAVGFKPAVLQKMYRGTNYVLGLIPLGGYVKIWGENGSEEVENDKDNPTAFYNRPRSAQILVLLGGIIFNVLFAWILFAVVFMSGTEVAQSQFPDQELEGARVEVLQVIPDSPIDQAGIEVGFEITEVRHGDLRARTQATTIQSFIKAHSNKEITVMYKDQDGQVGTVAVTSYQYEGKDIIGFGIERIGHLQLSWLDALYHAGKTTVDLSVMIMTSLVGLLVGVFSGGEAMSQLSGPVGIASYAQDAFTLGWSNFVYFVALLSLNLAVFNLLPIPALDGGRIVFVLIESVLRRPLNPRWFMWVNAGGFLLLIALMLWVTAHDIITLFL